MKKINLKFKQMTFDTAVRNPERYIEILRILKNYEGKKLNDDVLLEIVSNLYLNKIVTSKEIIISEETLAIDIKEEVIKVNRTRRADGGFPSGYASRFWTYVRTLSELGFVYARYNEELRLSEITKKLINGDMDEQEAFSIQAIRHNRKNPYRKVKNDFNYFRFILLVLLRLKENNKFLSYEQFILSLFSKTGNVEDFINLINNNSFNNYDSVYEYVKEKYKVTNRFETIIQDYPDVVRRVLIISGFITVRFSGRKFMEINENKINYIKEILDYKLELTEEQKVNPKKYFEKLNSDNKILLDIVRKYRKEDVIDAEDYLNKLQQIISNYDITKDKIIKGINQIGSRTISIEEFKDIPDPLKLEFFIAILIFIVYGDNFLIKPNYKADHYGKPYSHAPGNKGDIEVYSDEIFWLIEVTLIRNKIQQINFETTSVIRHMISNEKFDSKIKKYLSFVAPIIHNDTKEWFEYNIFKNRVEKNKLFIKPYSIKEFMEVTKNKRNFEDMEKYSHRIIKELFTSIEKNN